MHTSVAIIGAGFAGIGAAIRLRERGIDDLAIFERDDRVGATSHRLAEHRHQELFSRAEIVQQCRMRHADLLGDGAQRRSFGPLVDEYLDRAIEDLLPSSDALGIRPLHAFFRHAPTLAIKNLHLVVFCYRHPTNLITH